MGRLLGALERLAAEGPCTAGRTRMRVAARPQRFESASDPPSGETWVVSLPSHEPVAFPDSREGQAAFEPSSAQQHECDKLWRQLSSPFERAGWRSLGVATCGSQGGGALVSRLAHSAAAYRTGRVLTIEARPRESTECGGAPPAVVAGVTDLLWGRIPVEALLPGGAERGIQTLSYGSGDLPPDLVVNETAGRLLHYCEQHFDLVLVDLGDLEDPLTPVMAPSCDAVLLTIVAGRVTRREARKAAETLRRAGVRLIGAIVFPDSLDR